MRALVLRLLVVAHLELRRRRRGRHQAVVRVVRHLPIARVWALALVMVLEVIAVAAARRIRRSRRRHRRRASRGAYLAASRNGA